MNAKVDSYGKSVLGGKRLTNEDQFLIADFATSITVRDASLDLADDMQKCGGSRAQLYTVADGMGGASAGEHASLIAVSSLTRFMLNDFAWNESAGEYGCRCVESELRQAVISANREIGAAAEVDSGLRGMGTTLTGALVMWPRAFVFHVGDTRCYLCRGGRLEQLTTDHTMSALLANSSVDSQSVRSLRHVLYNALGGETPELSVDLCDVELHRHDTLLLCSDGLHTTVPEQALADQLGSDKSAEQICMGLIDEATTRRSGDDATAIVARFGRPTPETGSAVADHSATTSKVPLALSDGLLRNGADPAALRASSFSDR